MDKKTTVSTENVEMIYSNRICCFNDKQIDFNHKLTDKKDGELKIHFLFEYSDSSKREATIESNSDNGVNIKLTNFNSPLGAGLKKPIRIAKLDGKSIFIIFNVYKSTGSNPILDLSLYMENDNGK